MKIKLLFLNLIFFSLAVTNFLFAQSGTINCLTDQLQEKLKAAHPDRGIKEREINRIVYDHFREGTASRPAAAVIPVVVHIFHMNGPENISNQAVLQGIEDLNQAFSNTGSYQKPSGVNTGIQFCIALQDPDGLPTNGITRHESALTNLTSDLQDAELKAIVQWDPTRYLNIYLVNEITSLSMGSGVAGYAFFPSSHGAPEDGIVNEARFFGSSTDNSKVHIHEAGHYLGLYHTFSGDCTNNDCLADGDRICDTPPDASAEAVPCNNFANTCSSDSDDPSVNNPFRPVALGGSGDSHDLSVNYMDYGLQNCQISFTQGQSDRMNEMLNGPRESLLSSEGCNNSCGVFASGFNVGNEDFTWPIFAGLNMIGFYQSTVPYHLEWLVNGEIVSSDSVWEVHFPSSGIYNVSFLSSTLGS